VSESVSARDEADKIAPSQATTKAVGCGSAVPRPPVAPPPVREPRPAGTPQVADSPETAPGRSVAAMTRRAAGFGVSAVVHAVLMVVLALIVVARNAPRGNGPILVSWTPEMPPSSQEDIVWEVDLSQPHQRLHDAWLPEPPAETPQIDLARKPTPADIGRRAVGLESLGPRQWATPVRVRVGGGLEGRTPQARARLAGQGGTDASEAAVERGLRWLVAHQGPDGGWNFDHTKSLCRGLCRNPGDEKSTTAATALALAPFLGAGYTHTRGEHREVVRRGLYYLESRAFVHDGRVDLREGTMYAQGLATIVLCEAYSMTGDQSLAGIAQGALRFIEYAQDQHGGGWRYYPGDPGDTTVTGWQLMALKSGQMAGFQVKSPVLSAADRFLDSVQSEEGAKYGYMDRNPGPTTTAIGLLCRMYSGWPRSRPALAAGVDYLAYRGPSQNDMYYNYYATQVMRHWGGSPWQRWNAPMRDYLVATQATKGHEAGSWYFDHKYARKGGRLYTTAMAVMILEIYYRYMPLYRDAWKPAAEGAAVATP